MKIWQILLAILVTILVFGCSSRDNAITLQKDLDSGLPSIDQDKSLPVGVSDYFVDGSPSGGEGVLGMFTLRVSKNPPSAELESMRKVSLVDVLEVVDITNFMTLAPCTDCVKLSGIYMNSENHPVVKIGIKHPFPAGDPFKPISGKNRADLHVFNVEGILISNATGVSFPGINQTVAGFNLVNADGYTGYLDASLDSILPTDATIHPYVTHFDDYGAGNFNPTSLTGFESVTTPPPSGNLVMPMGSDYNFQDYELDLPVTSMEFIFAVGCTYGVSASNKAMRFTPEYRVPQHNKKAASEVRVEIVSNDLTDGDVASSATLRVKVLDISHGVATGTGLDQMLSDSSVGSISVEVPGVTSSPVEIVSPTPLSGNGRDPLNPLLFEVSITNSSSGVAGTYPGLVKVLDTYLPGQNTSPLLNGKDGITRVDPAANPLTSTFDISEFATYAIFNISVETGFTSLPPVSIISQPCPDTVLKANSYLFFDGRFSTDDFPPIVGYAWDFDWDGNEANFYADSTLDHLNWKFTAEGTFTVGLRVQDSEGQFGYSSINLTVEPETSRAWRDPIPVASWDGVEASERNYNPSHQVVVDCDGIVHIIVKFRNNTSPNTSGLYYVNYDGSTMSDPEYIDGTMDFLFQPTLKIDYNNDLHFCYLNVSDVKYCKRSAGVWSTPEVITNTAETPGYGIEYPSMAINYKGEVRVIFTKLDSSYKWFIAEVHNDGSGWTDPIDITEVYLRVSSGSYQIPNEDLLADPEGNFHLVYKSWPSESAVYDTDLWHLKCIGGVWGTTSRFCDDGGLNIALGGYIAPDGDLFAVWQTNRFGTFDVMYQRYDSATQTWGSSIRVSQTPLSGDYSFIPDIAVDAGGKVMYVWEYYDGVPGNERRHLFYKTFQETDNATDILNASENEVVVGDWNRTNPNLFFEPNGRVHLVYEDNRADPSSYWSTDMYYSVWE